MRSLLVLFLMFTLHSTSGYSQDTIAVETIDQAVSEAQKGNFVSIRFYMDSSSTFPSEFQRIPKNKLIGLVVDNCNYVKFPAFLSDYNQIVYLRYSWFMFSDSPLKRIPEFIYDLENLETLLIERLPVGSIPDKLGTLHNLISLSLYDLELMQFPHAVLSLTKLRKLDLSANKFTTVPAGISNLQNLVQLDFEGGASGATPLQSLPKTIGALKKLEAISLGYTEVGIGDLPDSFYELESLKSFDCNACGFIGFDERVANLPLERVHLMNLYGMNALPEAFFELSTMKKFRCYSYCQGTCDAFEAQQDRIRSWGEGLENFSLEVNPN